MGYTTLIIVIIHLFYPLEQWLCDKIVPLRFFNKRFAIFALLAYILKVRLWGIKNLHGLDLEASEDVPISSFPRRRDYKAVTVTTDMPSLLQAAIDQNFVPVVDDRNVFIGMVRRTVILRDVYNKYGAKLD